MKAPKITIFSTPLVSTWVFDDTHRLLFDAGDGVAATLDSRIQRIRMVAITHTHRDHCAGMTQLLNLRGGLGEVPAAYPAGSGSAKVLAEFLTAFNSRTSGNIRWLPTEAGGCISIEPARHFVRAFETRHYRPTPPARTQSLGYQVVRTVDKVRSEFRDLPQDELDALRLAHGRDHLLETVEDILLTVTGDTMPLAPEQYRGSRVLLHECTFLYREEQRDSAAHGDPHSSLEDVLEVAVAAGVERLGLYHVSRRYEDSQVLNRVRDRCAALAVPFPVTVALPGRLYEDLFSTCVWPGNGTQA